MDIEYLVDKYSKLVYKICYNMLSDTLDAEDVTQETYLSLYKNLDRYGNLTENEIKNVICKIALNKCKDILKSSIKKIDNMIDSNELALENYQSDNDMEDELFKKEKSDYVKKVINNLKKPYSNLLYEYYINEMSLDELVVKNNVSKATLKMQLHRARDLLKKELKKFGGEHYYE